MKRFSGVIVFVLLLSASVFAEEEPRKGPQPLNQDTQEEHAAHHSNASTSVQAPLPPGLEKAGKLPPGLEKQGKTPHGWSQGKAWWKHAGQPPHAVHSTGNGGIFTGGHSGRANPGHGPR